MDLNLINNAGQSIHIRKKSASTASTVEMDVSACYIPAGMYLLQIGSGTHKEALKILVAE